MRRTWLLAFLFLTLWQMFPHEGYNMLYAQGMGDESYGGGYDCDDDGYGAYSSSVPCDETPCVTVCNKCHLTFDCDDISGHTCTIRCSKCDAELTLDQYLYHNCDDPFVEGGDDEGGDTNFPEGNTSSTTTTTTNNSTSTNTTSSSSSSYILGELSKFFKYGSFVRNHPWEAIVISIPTENGKNISSDAMRFANNLFSQGDNYTSISGESKVNACRHVLWQALITQRFGEQIALEAGNAHENNPLPDTSIRNFQNTNEADPTVDLLNNVIGRNLGKTSGNCSQKELASYVLEEFCSKGLYVTIPDSNGGCSIVQKKISYSEYRVLLDNLNNLDIHGFFVSP